MDFSYSPNVRKLQEQLTAFMEEHVYPNESVYEKQLNAMDTRWSAVPPVMEELKKKRNKPDYGIYFYLTASMGPGLPIWNTRRSVKSWAVR